MRVRIPSLRLFVPLFLGISAVAVPSAAHALPTPVSAPDGVEATGIYRLSMSATDRKTKTVHLVVRTGPRGITAMLLDRETELPLTNLRIEGTLLKGNVATSEGIGELVLQVGDGSVIGTLAVNGKLLLIEGDHHE